MLHGHTAVGTRNAMSHHCNTSVAPTKHGRDISDHSDGKANDEGKLKINDNKRHRITAGLTFSFGAPFKADVRLNYEAYIYPHDGESKTGVSDHNKLVCELMVRF